MLHAHHDRRSFTRGDPELDGYLKRFARQHAETKVSRTYVAVNGAAILGYYSLAMAAIREDQLPSRYQSRFSNDPLPVARLPGWRSTIAIKIGAWVNGYWPTRCPGVSVSRRKSAWSALWSMPSTSKPGTMMSVSNSNDSPMPRLPCGYPRQPSPNCESIRRNTVAEKSAA